jgi:L-ribulose-5-phosphate 4-epimerase
MSEGVIKFKIKEWNKTSALDENLWLELEALRSKLYSLKLIGFDEKLKIGYGNISKRIDEKSFVITASQTGHLPKLDGNGYCIIREADLDKNSVIGEGAGNPSSESINSVIHVHSDKMWKMMIDKGFSSTPPEAEYGSLLLSEKIGDIVKNLSMGKPLSIVMKGHENGIIIAGSTLNNALRYIFELYEIMLKSSLKNSFWK